MYWPRDRTEIDRLIEAADLPDRDQRIAKLEKRRSFFEPSGASSSKVVFAQRYDGLGRMMSLLESAARVAVREPPLAGVTVAEDHASVPGFDGAVVSIPIPR